MAIGTPTLIASSALNDANTFITVTLTASAAVGDLVLVAVYGDSASPTSVDDSGSNSWSTADASDSESNIFVALWSLILTDALTSGSSTITANLSAGGSKGLIAAKVTGIAASPLDKTAINSSFLSNWSVGPTATTTQADELIIGVGAENGQASGGDFSAPGGSMVEVTEVADSSNCMVMQYQIVSSTGTYSASGTWDNTTLDWAALIATYKGGATSQIANPSADSVDNSWTDQGGGSSLAAAIDEDTASDTDYIRSPAGPQDSGCRVKLESLSDPASSSGHAIHWRIAKDLAGGDAISMTVKLYQGGGDSLGGGTLIADFVRSGADVDETFTTFDESLSAGEADSITNYGDLYLEFWADTA